MMHTYGRSTDTFLLDILYVVVILYTVVWALPAPTITVINSLCTSGPTYKYDSPIYNEVGR